jgi:hypothetical protein
MKIRLEGYQTAVSNLSNDDLNKVQILSEFKLRIGALPSAQRKAVVSGLHFEKIFDCLNCSET